MKRSRHSNSFLALISLTLVLVIGLLAAILACCVLGGLAYALYYYQPGVEEVITWEVLAVTAISVFLFGIIITFVCSWISVNRFLRMRAGELYKI